MRNALSSALAWASYYNKSLSSLATAVSFYLVAMGYVTDEEKQILTLAGGIVLDILWKVFGPANGPKPGEVTT